VGRSRDPEKRSISAEKEVHRVNLSHLAKVPFIGGPSREYGTNFNLPIIANKNL